jgi:hypothetical protein
VVVEILQDVIEADPVVAGSGGSVAVKVDNDGVAARQRIIEPFPKKRKSKVKQAVDRNLKILTF